MLAFDRGGTGTRAVVARAELLLSALLLPRINDGGRKPLARAARHAGWVRGALARFNNVLYSPSLVALSFLPHRHFYLRRSHAGQWFHFVSCLVSLKQRTFCEWVFQDPALVARPEVLLHRSKQLYLITK